MARQPRLRIRRGLAELTMPEYRTVSTLIPRIALGTIVILVVGTVATGNNNNVTTNVNKPIYLGVLVLALAVTNIFLRNRHSPRFDSAVALLASGGLAWGVWTIEPPKCLEPAVTEAGAASPADGSGAGRLRPRRSRHQPVRRASGRRGLTLGHRGRSALWRSPKPMLTRACRSSPARCPGSPTRASPPPSVPCRGACPWCASGSQPGSVASLEAAPPLRPHDRSRQAPRAPRGGASRCRP